ncbi:hypothetical protein, partial [Anaplasma phagocytophilum]|uniref:hypothetical protein n=1 Tax=Anaplasma phagocytophilum TaxID=948 RepID=UPI0031F75C54
MCDDLQQTSASHFHQNIDVPYHGSQCIIEAVVMICSLSCELPEYSKKFGEILGGLRVLYSTSLYYRTR